MSESLFDYRHDSPEGMRIAAEYGRPPYHPATDKADWIAYSERLEAAIVQRDIEIARVSKRLFKAESWNRPKG